MNGNRCFKAVSRTRCFCLFGYSCRRRWIDFCGPIHVRSTEHSRHRGCDANRHCRMKNNMPPFGSGYAGLGCYQWHRFILGPLGPPSSSSAFSPDRKADPSVTGVFTFRRAPLSFERRWQRSADKCRAGARRSVRRAWREATCMVHVVWEPVRETEPDSHSEGCRVDVTGRWKEGHASYPGRSGVLPRGARKTGRWPEPTSAHFSGIR